jgi:tight adherence protein B
MQSMSAAMLVMTAAVVLAVPIPSYAGLRLRAFRPERAGGGPGRVGAGAPVGTGPVPTAVLAAAAAGLIAALAAVASGATHRVVAPALAGALTGAVGGWLVGTVVAARRDDRLLGSLVAAIGALSAELRAGRAEAAALGSAAAVTEPELGAVLQGAGDAAAEGADVAGTLQYRTDAAALPPAVRSALLRVAAAWAVSRDCGTPIASVLDQVYEDLRAHRRRTQLIAAQLAGPRATAVLLSLLPALGIVLGTAIGAHPVGVLLGTAPGQLALLVGVCLDVAGVLWTVRIVRAAGRGP